MMTSDFINYSPEILIPFALLVGLTCFFRAIAPSWVYPGPFFSLYWVVTIAISMPFDRFPLWSGTVWWLLATIFAFCVGSFLGGFSKTGYPVKEVDASERQRYYPWLEKIIIICFVLGVVRIIFLGKLLDNPMGDQPPAWLQLCLTAIYLADMLGGVLLGSAATNRGRVIAFLGIVPQISYSLLYGGRSSLVLGIFFFCGGYYGMKIFLSEGRVRFLTAKLISGTVGLLLCLFFMGVLIGVFRYDAKPNEAFEDRLTRYATNFEDKILNKAEFLRVTDKFSPVIFGNIYSFSYFFKPVWNDPVPEYFVTIERDEPHYRHYWNKPRPKEYGRLTFRGILRVFGIEPVLIKQYPSFPVLGAVHSNVYTSFMPPILDFGLYGSLIFYFLFGLLMGFSYRKLADGHLGFVAVFCFFFAHVLNSGGLFFPYNSINLALIIVGLSVIWARNAVPVKDLERFES